MIILSEGMGLTSSVVVILVAMSLISLSYLGIDALRKKRGEKVMHLCVDPEAQFKDGEKDIVKLTGLKSNLIIINENQTTEDWGEEFEKLRAGISDSSDPIHPEHHKATGRDVWDITNDIIKGNSSFTKTDAMFFTYAFKHFPRAGLKVAPGLTSRQSKIQDLKKVITYTEAWVAQLSLEEKENEKK